MKTEDLIRKVRKTDKKLDEMVKVIDQQIKEFLNSESDLTYKEMNRVLECIKPWEMGYKAETKRELLKIIKTYLNEVMHEQKISSVNTGINTDEN